MQINPDSQRDPAEDSLPAIVILVVVVDLHALLGAHSSAFIHKWMMRNKTQRPRYDWIWIKKKGVDLIYARKPNTQPQVCKDQPWDPIHPNTLHSLPAILQGGANALMNPSHSKSTWWPWKLMTFERTQYVSKGYIDLASKISQDIGFTPVTHRYWSTFPQHRGAKWYPNSSRAIARISSSASGPRSPRFRAAISEINQRRWYQTCVGSGESSRTCRYVNVNRKFIRRTCCSPNLESRQQI